MGPAARIEPGPKSFWGLNWLQNQDFGQSITKARDNIDQAYKTIYKSGSLNNGELSEQEKILID
jgi:hypothetical protein